MKRLKTVQQSGVWLKKYYIDKKAKLFEKLKMLMSDGIKFSAMVDEWTDKKHATVTLRSKKINNIQSFNNFVIDLIKINSKCDAITLINLVKEKIKRIGFNLHRDIVDCTHGGASIIIKFWKTLVWYRNNATII